MSNDECKACACTCQGEKLKEVKLSLVGKTPKQLRKMAEELEKKLETQQLNSEAAEIQECADKYALQAIRNILSGQAKEI